MGSVLADAGFSVSETSSAASVQANSAETLVRGFDYTICELIPGESGQCNFSSEELQAISAGSRVVCLADRMTPCIADTLKSAGISDCLCSWTPHAAADYIQLLDNEEQPVKGVFALLDSDNVCTSLIHGIIRRFGYSLNVSSKIEDFYNSISTCQPVISLLNLGAPVDFNRFIRESHSSSLKKSPVIAYKDMSGGIFIHEVLNGLSKITKLILTPDELYSLLADMLIKREITAAISRFNKTAEFEKYRGCGEMALSQMYYSMQPDPCRQAPLLTHEKNASMCRDLDVIKKYLLLAEGIRWLKDEQAAPAGPICGAGA